MKVTTIKLFKEVQEKIRLMSKERGYYTYPILLLSLVDGDIIFEVSYKGVPRYVGQYLFTTELEFAEYLKECLLDLNIGFMYFKDPYGPFNYVMASFEMEDDEWRLYALWNDQEYFIIDHVSKNSNQIVYDIGAGFNSSEKV